MQKKQLFIATLLFALAFCLGTSVTPQAYAEEINQGAIEVPDDSAATDSNTSFDAGDNASTPPAAEPQSEPTDQNAGNTTNHDGTSADNNAVTGGRNSDDNSGSASNVYVDDNSNTNLRTETETTEQPSPVPMIVSLCALGLVIIAIIVFNLLGRRKNGRHKK